MSNSHRNGGYNSQEDLLDSLLGRGAGDIDMIGYPEPVIVGDTAYIQLLEMADSESQ